MSRRRVLAIAQDLDQLRRIVANLERAGAQVDAVRSLAALPGDRLPHRTIFLALSPTAGADPLAELAGAGRIREDAKVAVLLDAERAARLGEVVTLLADPHVHHVIVGEELDRGVFVTAQKLLTSDIFGIEKYLPEGTPVRYARVHDYAERGEAVEAVLDFAASARVRSQLRAAIGSVCEELLMNALYDAPVDDRGRPMFAEIEPSERTRARSPRPVSIRYAVTDSEFAVAVRDRYGRLTKQVIVAYLDKCLRNPRQIDGKPHGAGLGLYLVASSAASYVVNVAEGVATEVVCTFSRGPRAPLRLASVFVHPGPGSARPHTAAP